MTEIKPSPRRQALDILLDVSTRQAYSNLALRAGVKSANARDAALIKQLVFGTITYRRALDHLLSNWLKQPLQSLDPQVLGTLRLGLYQIVYLGTPDHAAVSESVNLARAVSNSGAAGLVNAVLRRAVRERDRLPWPKTDDQAQDLAVFHSFPDWMVRRWLARLGTDETEAFCRSQNLARGVDLRLNSLRGGLAELLQSITADGFQAVPHALVPGSVLLAGGSLPQLSALQSGLCTVQGAASTLVGLVVDAQPGDLVYDLCAAPGGKALHLAELMQDRGQVVAVDSHAGRLKLIVSAAERLGIKSVTTLHADARQVAIPTTLADRVLVDAPCSGLGVIRRKPDIRWQRTASDLTELAVLQQEILTRAAELVRVGGVLVYSVCSTEPEETTEVIDQFLSQHPGFQPVAWPQELQSIFAGQVTEGQLTTYPHRHDLDGFYICRLQRQA